MEDLIVTRIWMAGVVGMMLILATIAVVGVIKEGRDDSND